MELKEVHRLTPVSLLLATSLLTAVESVLPIPPNTEANLLASLAQEDALSIGENLSEAILSHLGSKRAGMRDGGAVHCAVAHREFSWLFHLLFLDIFSPLSLGTSLCLYLFHLPSVLARHVRPNEM